jgi:SAM-dependent methyltransferase
MTALGSPSVAANHLVAYLAGLEGVALLRAEVEGDSRDSEFVGARLNELAEILAARDGPLLDAEQPEVVQIDTVDGYSIWAGNYDGWNPLIEIEEPPIRRLIDSLPIGEVLDAATGTGRHAAYLAAGGHRVIGVDNCEAMLEVARTKLPEVAFRLGDLTDLPLADDSVDAVVCSLALTHQTALEPAFAEFARVLRRGGQVIISDIHHLSLYMGGVARVALDDHRVGRMTASRFLPSDYLRAALATDYSPLDFQEIPWPDLDGHGGPAAQQWCPDAARAAYVGFPAVIIWHLRYN